MTYVLRNEFVSYVIHSYEVRYNNNSRLKTSYAKTELVSSSKLNQIQIWSITRQHSLISASKQPTNNSKTRKKLSKS